MYVIVCGPGKLLTAIVLWTLSVKLDSMLSGSNDVRNDIIQ